MAALYLIGGAIAAAMWVGLIYVMVLEPIRGRIHRESEHHVAASPRRLRVGPRRPPHRDHGYRPRHLARGH
jgi:hypothetical protein